MVTVVAQIFHILRRAEKILVAVGAEVREASELLRRD